MTKEQFTALRTSLGLTQAQMGHALGLSQAQVSRIEQGKRGITPMLQKLLASRGAGQDEGERRWKT